MQCPQQAHICVERAVRTTDLGGEESCNEVEGNDEEDKSIQVLDGEAGLKTQLLQCALACEELQRRTQINCQINAASTHHIAPSGVSGNKASFILSTAYWLRRALHVPGKGSLLHEPLPKQNTGKHAGQQKSGHTSPMMEVAIPIMAARDTKSSLDLVKPRLTVFSPSLNCCALMSLPATSFLAGAFATAPCTQKQRVIHSSVVVIYYTQWFSLRPQPFATIYTDIALMALTHSVVPRHTEARSCKIKPDSSQEMRPIRPHFSHQRFDISPNLKEQLTGSSGARCSHFSWSLAAHHERRRVRLAKAEAKQN